MGTRARVLLQAGQRDPGRLLRRAVPADALSASAADAGDGHGARGQGDARRQPGGGNLHALQPAAPLRDGQEQLQQADVLSAAAQHAGRVHHGVVHLYRLRRGRGLADHAHEPQIQEVHLHRLRLSLHHARLDAGDLLADVLQERERRRGHLQRHHGGRLRCVHAGVVRLRLFPDLDGARAALRALCVYPHRRHPAQHGRQP